MDSGVSHENLKHDNRHPVSDMSDLDDHPENPFQRTLLVRQAAKPRKMNKRGLASRSPGLLACQGEQHNKAVNGVEASDIAAKKQVPGTSFEVLGNRRTGGCYDHVVAYDGDALDTTPTPASLPSSPGTDQSEGYTPIRSSPPLFKQEVVETHHQSTVVTECEAPRPEVVFHNVDKRFPPAAPSYEEHIQRTQSSKPQRATSVHPSQHVVREPVQPVRQSVQPVHIAQAIRKPKVSKNSSAQRHSVEDYVPPQPTPDRSANRKTSTARIPLPGVGLSPMNSSLLNGKTKTHNNFTTFISRKSKYQNRKDASNGANNANKSHHYRKSDDSSGSEGSPPRTSEHLHNANIANQVRDTMLATQTREDMLTTNNHNNSGRTTKNNHNHERIPEEGYINDAREIRENSGKCGDEGLRGQEGKGAGESGTKSKQPRISVTVMSNVR